MKPEDEILLTDYLEGDLEASKVEYVEKLLKEDAEAQKLLNQLKKAEIQIDSVLNSDAFNELDGKVSSFLESKFSENKLFDSLKSFFIPQALLGYALTGVVFFNIGTGGLSFSESPSSGYLTEFNYKEPFEKTYFKFRGSKVSEADQHIQESLGLMLKEKRGLAEITYGSEKIRIEIQEEKISDNNLKCYEGKVNLDETDKHFLYCESSSSSSLIFK
tara:strand:+ start:705 stop:1355 length:651 start_codon:yes stop_codon:yes gene_type:complete